MKTNRAILAVAGIAMMALVAVMFSACEKDGNTDTVDDLFGDVYRSEDRDKESPESLSILPSAPSVTKVGEQVALTVRGGQKPYKWSVSDASIGTVSPTWTKNDVEQVIYKALKLTKNTVVVTDGIGRAAVVDIAGDVPSLVVSPAALSFLGSDMVAPTALQTYQFTTTGGLTPITWKTDSPSLGTITANGGLWTSIQPGAGVAAAWTSNSVTVIATDAEGSTANSTITFK